MRSFKRTSKFRLEQSIGFDEAESMLCQRAALRALKRKIFLLADRIEREGKHHFLPYFSRRIFFPFPHFLRSEWATLNMSGDIYAFCV